MTYEEGIIGIPKQFEYQAEVLNKEKLRPFKHVVVLGMGGSRLAADVLNILKPELQVYVHSDFDLPSLSEEFLADALIIANSYSGETLETISGAKTALKQKLNLAIVAGAGELLNIAHKESLPHVLVPHEADLPARIMFGSDLLAIAALIDLNLASAFCGTMNALRYEAPGKHLASQMNEYIPLIYTSSRFNQLGYIWKVILNETAKVPAFHNRFPEFDHNELESFERVDHRSRFYAVILKDAADTRVARRMDAIVPILQAKGVPVTVIPLEGDTLIEKVMTSVILAHWVAAELAHKAKLDPTMTMLIEEFKKQIRD